MNLYDESRIIVLNSTDATKLNSTMNSSVRFNFSGLLKPDTNIIHSHIQLMALQIPNSFYTINGNNNKLFYTFGTIFSITIPVGNYNVYSLISTMTSLFITNGHNIGMTFSKINGKITYTSTSNFTFNTTGSTILKILGFLPSVNTSSIGNTLVSTFPLNLIGTKRIMITSTSLATNAIHSKNSQTSSILATIIVDEPKFGLITHSGTSNVNHLLKVLTIDTIDLQLLDEDGNFIDLNNCEWTMKLKISSTYELVLDSKTTFKEITQQKSIPSIPEIPVFSPDTDLELLLYNSKNPLK